MTAETEKADADLSKKVEQINKVLKYLPDLRKHEDAEHEYLVAVSELHDMLKVVCLFLETRIRSSAVSTP